MANPLRLRIIAKLAAGRDYLSHLAREIGVSRPLLHLHPDHPRPGAGFGAKGAVLMFGAETTWPEAIIFLGILLAVMLLIGIAASAFLEFRKTKLLAAQEDNLRQLVRRYEQLSETTLDAQQRVAADVSELRTRTTTIEQILRTVEQ